MRWLVVLAALALVGWLVLANTPPKLDIVPRGIQPEAETYKIWCYGDDSEVRGCTGVGRYRWPLAAGATAVTTWGWGPEASTSGTLTAQNPGFDLHLPLSGPPGDVTMTLRRSDSAVCAGAVTWEQPGLALPGPLSRRGRDGARPRRDSGVTT
jgi:hypothetical protein